jgi:tRNA A-37 threonylcarbamoyl transferase component Bud32
VRELGKYRLLEPIASGGMAEVWRAEMPGHAGFVKEVALKLVRADDGEGGEIARMFVQEAKLASRLHHANIVHVFGFERVDGRYAIAMELVRGQSLRAVLDRCREAGVRFGLPRSVHVAAEVARALAYAHRPRDRGGVAGIVHRDVSPQNVLVSFEGEVKLADFGIARALDAAGLTNPGTLKGKVAYMAPEQARGQPVDARADLFALGVVLWEMCTGGRLFARETEAATLAAVAAGAPCSRPSAWNEDVPLELDELVLAALERDPERRTASAEEMARRLAEIRLRLSRSPDDADLRPLMRRLFPQEAEAAPRPPGPGAPAAGASGVARSPVAGEPVAPWEARTRTLPGRRRRRQLAGAALAVGAVALGAAGLAAWRRGTLEARRVVDGADLPRPPAVAAPGSSRPPEGAPLAGGAAAGPSAAAPGPAADAPGPVAAAGQAGATAEGEGRGREGQATDARPGGAAPPGPSADPPAPSAVRNRALRKPAARGSASAGPAVRATGKWRGALALPPAQSGDGILFVNADPWAWVHVGGVEQGDTPLELRLPAGSHVLRLVSGDGIAVERRVEVRAGERQDLLLTPNEP